MAVRGHRLLVCVGVLMAGLLDILAETDIADVDVVIVGAGMAGLSAAKTLQDNGIANIQILEASGLVGGRLKQGTIGGKKVELGANWLRKGSATDPVWLLAQRAALVMEEEDFEDYAVYDDSGNDVTSEADERYDNFDPGLEALNDLAHELEAEKPHKPDISQRKALARGGWNPADAIDYAIEFFDIDYEYGHSPETASTRHSYIPGDADEGEHVVLDQTTGAQGMASVLAGDINGFTDKFKKNTKVTKIQYDTSGVTLTTEGGETYSADYVIVTCSLGVLKYGGITFEPELPAWKEYSIAGATFTNDYPVYLKFPAGTSIPEVKFVMHANQRRGYYTAWQNFNLFWPDSNILQVYLSGTEGERVSRLSPDQVKVEAAAVVRNMFGASLPDPEEVLVADWFTNPLFRGTYSDWSAAYPVSSHDALRAPVDRVYFAGEAYHREWFGYIQGAYYSGKDTALDIISCVSDSVNCYEYAAPYDASGCTYPSAENCDVSVVTDDGSCRFNTSPNVNTARGASLYHVILYSVMSTTWAVYTLLRG